MIIDCDDRERASSTVDPTRDAPWRFTGRFDGSSQCTGTLIADRFVLTAAHCFNANPGALTFSLAQEAENACRRPFGSNAARRIFIPRDFRTSDDETDRALDIAVVELWHPIEGARPVSFGHRPWQRLQNKTIRSVGYPSPPPDGGTIGSPWSTGIETFGDLQPFRWLDDGASGLLYSTLDGSGGQSGSPVVINARRNPTVIGVLIGSPVQNCELSQNWVARLTPGVIEHIENVIDSNTIDFWWRGSTVPQTADVPPC